MSVSTMGRGCVMSSVDCGNEKLAKDSGSRSVGSWNMLAMRLATPMKILLLRRNLCISI
jgi:hypothetical protein